LSTKQKSSRYNQHAGGHSVKKKTGNDITKGPLDCGHRSNDLFSQREEDKKYQVVHMLKTLSKSEYEYGSHSVQW